MTAADQCATVVDVSTVARPLDPNIMEIPAGFPMWHVGHRRVPFASFDTRSDTDYRFSPLTRNGARLPFDRVADRPVGVFTTTMPLRLVELHDPGLRKLGLRSTNLTDTLPMCYPHTGDYGQARLADHPDVGGSVWMSRRFNRDKVYLVIESDPHLITVSDTAGIAVTLPIDGI